MHRLELEFALSGFPKCASVTVFFLSFLGYFWSWRHPFMPALFIAFILSFLFPSPLLHSIRFFGSMESSSLSNMFILLYSLWCPRRSLGWSPRLSWTLRNPTRDITSDIGRTSLITTTGNILALSHRYAYILCHIPEKDGLADRVGTSNAGPKVW